MFIQGALRFFQGCATFRDSLKQSFFLSLGISILISLLIASKSVPTFKPYNLQLYAYSIVKDFFHDRFCSLRGRNNKCGMATVKLKNGREVYTRSIQRDTFIRRDLNKVKEFAYDTLKRSIGIFILFFIGIVVFLTRSGNRNKQENKIKTAKLVNKHLKKNKCLGNFKIGEMSLPKCGGMIS